jgi:hypothetical protein
MHQRKLVENRLKLRSAKNHQPDHFLKSASSNISRHWDGMMYIGTKNIPASVVFVFGQNLSAGPKLLTYIHFFQIDYT